MSFHDEQILGALQGIREATPDLRDQFAMSALQGILANRKINPYTILDSLHDHVHAAYKHADEMLKERDK